MCPYKQNQLDSHFHLRQDKGTDTLNWTQRRWLIVSVIMHLLYLLCSDATFAKAAGAIIQSNQAINI